MPYTIRAILSLVTLGALLLAVLPVLRSSEASPQTDEGLLWCWGVAPSTLSIYPSREAPTMASPNVATILRDHVSLSTSCVDRLYLNGYVPRLQSTGQLCAFLCEHLGNRIASPAAFRPLHDRFVQAITAFADHHLVPVVQFERGQRKDDVAAQYRARYQAAEGVVFIGVAQERQFSFKATKHIVPPHAVHFAFSRQSVAVNQYYFYRATSKVA